MSAEPSPSSSLSETDAARVSDYWEGQFAKNRADSSLWTNNRIVAQHVNRLISGGSEEHWIPWFLNRYVPSARTFDRSLSICCGDGVHEMALALSGRVGVVQGFDISEGAIAQALSRFTEAGIAAESYCFEVANADDLQLSGRFDLVLSTGALHHVNQLEELLAKVSEMMNPDAYFLVVDYVGPNRFQWSNRQISVINRILNALDRRYLKDQIRPEFGRPPLAEFLEIDPSEAARAEEIISCLENNFTIEYRSDFNGTLMHPLYPLLNPECTNADMPDFDSIVRMILVTEDLLVSQKILSSDFVFAICRPKGTTAAPRQFRTDETQRLVGYLDVFADDRIAGWAADLTPSAEPISVDLYFDDRLYATICCNAFRQDLVDSGIRDGCSSFEVEFDPFEHVEGQIARLTLAGTETVIATRIRRGARQDRAVGREDAH